MADFETTNKVLMLFSNVSPTFTVKDGMAETWAALAADIPNEAFLLLATQVARECQFPSLPEIAKRWEELNDDTRPAGEAFGRVMDWIRRSQTDTSLLTPLEVKTIKALGGRQVLAEGGDLSRLKAQFRDDYEAAAERERRERRMSPQLKALRSGKPQLGSGK